MIHRPVGLLALFQDLMPRLEVAHKTGMNIVARLRDASVDVYAGGPTPAPDAENPRRAYNAAGWVAHFASEAPRLAAQREKTEDAFARLMPELVEAETAYHATVPVIAALVQAVVDAHGGRVELLTLRERTQLADAIEAELET